MHVTADLHNYTQQLVCNLKHVVDHFRSLIFVNQKCEELVEFWRAVNVYIDKLDFF